jgi:hypothetical protein
LPANDGVETNNIRIKIRFKVSTLLGDQLKLASSS